MELRFETGGMVWQTHQPNLIASQGAPLVVSLATGPAQPARPNRGNAGRLGTEGYTNWIETESCETFSPLSHHSKLFKCPLNHRSSTHSVAIHIWHPAWLLVRIDDDSIIPLLRLSRPQSANHCTSTEGLSWRAVPEEQHQTQSQQKGHQELRHLKWSYMITQTGSKHQNSRIIPTCRRRIPSGTCL